MEMDKTINRRPVLFADIVRAIENRIGSLECRLTTTRNEADRRGLAADIDVCERLIAKLECAAGVRNDPPRILH